MSSSTTDQTLIDVVMPQMGTSVAEGTIVEWKVKVGDAVSADQTVCDVSTDKIDTECPAPAAGVLVEILVGDGETVEVGTVLARLSGDGASPAADPLGPDGDLGSGEAAAAVGGTPAPSSQNPAPVGLRPAKGEVASGSGQGRYSPVVQRVAAEHDLDLSQITGTGRGGRVRKADVLAHLEERASSSAGVAEERPLHSESPYRPDPEPAAVATPPRAQPAASPTADGAYAVPRPTPLSRMRRSIGEHMKRSLELAATCTTWMEADMTRIETARRTLGLTALPLVACCAIGALREHPELNAWIDGDTRTLHDDVNLGIAVSLGGDGLIVPVIRRAQDYSPEGVSSRIRDLARRARDRELSADDVQGGTFTITNPGQYGSLMATPVINQPQVAILDIETVTKRPVVITDADGRDSTAVRPMTVLGLSWDHRAMDGVLAAQYLAAVRRRMEGWELPA